jgi:hypothetical protein
MEYNLIKGTLMNIKIILILVTFLLVVSCTSLTVLDSGGCGTGTASNTCLGKQVIPDEQIEQFNKASQQVIDVLSSTQFQNELMSFIEQHAQEGKYVNSWVGFNASSIQTKIIVEINGMEVETYGGVYGWFYALFFGNKAFDGAKDGPIRLNRFALPRPSESIANTIAHEAAHRIGLSHPHSDKRGQLKVAYCEPPYIIGSIVEKILLAEKFNKKGHCHLLT